MPMRRLTEAAELLSFYSCMALAAKASPLLFTAEVTDRVLKLEVK
jgi:hypothetical protein